VSDAYLDRDGLLALGLDETAVDRLLGGSPLTGHDGRPVIEAGRLPDQLGLLRQAAGSSATAAGPGRGEP
jgi:hypothetical protein